MPAPGISRAAMVAFAAASLGAAACSSSETGPGGGNQRLRDGATDGANMAGTGGATADTGGNMSVVFYGAPFPPSGGSSNAGGNVNTAPDGGGMALPLYGAPFAPQKKP